MLKLLILIPNEPCEVFLYAHIVNLFWNYIHHIFECSLVKSFFDLCDPNYYMIKATETLSEWGFQKQGPPRFVFGVEGESCIWKESISRVLAGD